MPRTVTATSGPAELQEIYQENLLYDINSDVAMAGRFIASARAILALPEQSDREQESIQFDRSLVAAQLERAVQWHQVQTQVLSPPRQFVPQTDWRADL